METPKPSATQESGPLEYAPPAAWYERPVVRRAIRWTFVVGVALIAALVTWAAGRRAFLLHYQKQAMAFTAPPDRIAFTNDPAEVAKLLGAGSDYVPGIGMGGAAMLSIPPLRRLSEIEDEQYAFGYGFCHVRAAEGRAERLVKVCLPYTQMGGSPTLYLEARLRPIYKPMGVNDGLRPARFGGGDTFAIPLSPTDHFRLFAGQPDPSDPSHFTFRYELDDHAGTIDGWLMPDDSVKIEPRDGPLRKGAK